MDAPAGTLTLPLFFFSSWESEWLFLRLMGVAKGITKQLLLLISYG